MWNNNQEVPAEYQKFAGKQKIDSHMKDFKSKRAIAGKINVERKPCPYCHHHKVITCNANSSRFGKSKCSRCKRWIE